MTSELLAQLPEENREIKDKLALLLACKSEASWSRKFRKEDLARSVVKHIMISSVAAEIFSFMDSLSLFGVLELLKQYPERVLLTSLQVVW